MPCRDAKQFAADLAAALKKLARDGAGDGRRPDPPPGEGRKPASSRPTAAR